VGNIHASYASSRSARWILSELADSSNVPTFAELRRRSDDPAGALSALEGPVKVCASCGLRNIPERQRCKHCGAALGEIVDT